MDATAPDQVITFGPFRLDRGRRALFHGNDIVRIGGRAMDILLALAAQPGQLIGKPALYAAAWPNIAVHEANLKVTIAGLRRALRRHDPSTDYIKTVVGRGYWLGTKSGAAHQESRIAAALPTPRMLIGRDEELLELAALVDAHRLVTIVGAGGLGKTSLATAFAADYAAKTGITVSFVDLSRVAGDAFVAAALATALGINSGSDSLQAIASILARQKALLILDTCEHVLSAVTHICDVLLTRTQDVRILATSRQLLRARAEQLLRLEPLAVPRDGDAETIAGLLRYGASRLLIERARELGGYVPAERDAALLGRICRRLEGSPLAIELTAPRLAAQGAGAVLDELQQRLLVVRHGGAAPHRHQTLQITLQWSYALLTVAEATALRALSIFAGAFDAEGAIRVGASAGLTAVDTVDAIAGLRAKSMLTIDRADADRYRLLDSTRAFASALRDAEGETAAVAAGHARYVLEMLGAARRDAYPALIDELRLALDWTLYRSADPPLGIALVAAGLPLWHELSLAEEIRAACERALAELRRLGRDDKVIELQLVVGLATVSTYLSADPETASRLFRTAVDLARTIDDPVAECRVLGAFATYELMRARRDTVADALDAMHGAALRTGQPAALWEEGQLRAQYEIRTCQFETALARIQRLFEEIDAEAERAVPRFQIHQKLNVEIQMAALCWLTGRPGEAVRIASLAAADARAVDHGLTLVHCLAQGVVWTLIQCGEYATVLPYIEVLRTAIYRHGLPAWVPVLNCYTAAIPAFLGNRPDPACLRSAFYGVRAGMVQLRHDARYAMLAEAMLANGQPDDAAEVIRDVFDTNPDPWARCEFLRLQAAIERTTGHETRVKDLLIEALREAEACGSLAWRLRAARDLAALMRDRGDAPAARAILSPVYEAFDRSVETRDIREARRLLADLAQ